MKQWMCLLSALLVLLLSGTALADDATLGRVGEAVQPIHNTQVSMINEEVHVKIYRSKCEVTAIFHFRNDGPATTILVGFPEGGVDQERPEGWGDSLLHDFTTELDGVPVTVKREPGLQPDKDPRPYTYPSWLTWDVSFQKGETRKISNTYWVKNTHVSNGWMETGYVMSTGSLWNGPIGKAKVTMELMDVRPSQLVGVFPGDYRYEGNKLVWEWEGIEPTLDMHLVFNLRGPAFLMGSKLDQELVWTLDELIWSSDMHAVLREIEKLRQGKVDPKTEPLLTYYTALAQEALGQKAAALSSWEKLKALTGEPDAGFKPEDSAWAAYAETLYHLGRHYQADGKYSELARLYAWAKQVSAEDEIAWPPVWSPHVARWLEQWVPQQKVLSSRPELTATLEWEPESQVWQFSVQVTDLDADLSFYKSSFQMWYELDGERHWLVDSNNPDYPLERGYPGTIGMGNGLPFNHVVVDIPAGAKLFYQVDVMDAAGNKATVGSQAKRPDEDSAQPTDLDGSSGGATSKDTVWLVWLGLVLALLAGVFAIRQRRKAGSQ